MDNEEMRIQNKPGSLQVIKTELTRMPHTRGLSRGKNVNMKNLLYRILTELKNLLNQYNPTQI